MKSGLGVGARVSDTELWPCESCGVRMLTTERVITASGTGNLRWSVGAMRLCDRCYRLHPHLFLFCAYYLLKYGKILPQLEEWLAKSCEPTFDLHGHILRTHGVSDGSGEEQTVEPYKPSKIIVALGA